MIPCAKNDDSGATTTGTIDSQAHCGPTHAGRRSRTRTLPAPCLHGRAPTAAGAMPGRTEFYSTHFKFLKIQRVYYHTQFPHDERGFKHHWLVFQWIAGSTPKAPVPELPGGSVSRGHLEKLSAQLWRGQERREGRERRWGSAEEKEGPLHGRLMLASNAPCSPNPRVSLLHRISILAMRSGFNFFSPFFTNTSAANACH